MLDFFYPKHPFESQTLRLVAEAQQGGGDIFDIARLCRKIEPGDKQGWERAWLDLAHATEIEAKEVLTTGQWKEVKWKNSLTVGFSDCAGCCFPFVVSENLSREQTFFSQLFS